MIAPAAPGTADAVAVTGSRHLDKVLPHVQQVIDLVHRGDADGIGLALADADRVLRRALRNDRTPVPAGIELGTRAVLTVLAGLVLEDRSPADLLGWLQDPAEYERLVSTGVDAGIARTLCANKRTGVAA
ncbi:Hypothetical protein AJAP_42880 (plasmid) [Amycolatopsis japonica]|uniref:Uncharacterized protein n=1 Tax=Amycolatopsis japonica TaxID=208439 RepID=A0A075V781_9PSEU|nr:MULTISPECIES: hypothetical protein [Amycolatopsis]AIG81343.1 Hypothetical protein AJAP_42880 [Amycolatopsis japonica]RSN38530.1 hypothetical protein DMC64_41420 [Amycolatopsis sp. WAC 04197]